MYVYDQYDQQIVEDRVKQFADQTRRYLAGELSGEEFRPLRLQNGLYIQRFAPMLRIAVPYGLLRASQVRMLAKIARDYDKGYAHISTRQNVQFNWPELEDVPAILGELATVQMHAIQTSGNCIRNTTTDQFAGVAKDELVDPRPWCEIILLQTMPLALHGQTKGLSLLFPMEKLFEQHVAVHLREALSADCKIRTPAASKYLCEIGRAHV